MYLCNLKPKCCKSKHFISIPLSHLMIFVNLNNSCKFIKISSIIIILIVYNKSKRLHKNNFPQKSLILLRDKFFMMKKTSSLKSLNNMITSPQLWKECLCISFLKGGLNNGNSLFLLNQKLLAKTLDP